MKNTWRLLILSLAGLFLTYPSVFGGAPTPAWFDKTVHDFGTVSMSDGPVSCTFTLTNRSDEPVNIFAVLTTCGCTKVKWTREEIKPGKTGKVEATFSNDEGAYPFDKSVMVYLADDNKPIVLHLKGVAKR